MRGAGFLLATCACLLGAMPAAAQDNVAATSMSVTGSTPQVCTIETGRFRTGELINFVGNDGDTLRVIELVDPDDLAVQAASATVSFEAVCNFPHRIRLESQENGLWPISGAFAPTSEDFATALPYSASFEWADRSRSLELDATVRQGRLVATEVDEPASGELVLAITLDAGASNTQFGAPVLAGTYTDTLRIFLEPR